jgi:hypothetical protein
MGWCSSPGSLGETLVGDERERRAMNKVGGNLKTSVCYLAINTRLNERT